MYRTLWEESLSRKDLSKSNSPSQNRKTTELSFVTFELLSSSLSSIQMICSYQNTPTSAPKTSHPVQSPPFPTHPHHHLLPASIFPSPPPARQPTWPVEAVHRLLWVVRVAIVRHRQALLAGALFLIPDGTVERLLTLGEDHLRGRRSQSAGHESQVDGPF